MSKKLSSDWSEVDVFTSGEELLYGYDSLNPCLLITSSDGCRPTRRLHFSSTPTWPIRRLILNGDESLIALLADRLAYLVQLPSSESSSSLCPILRVNPLNKSSGSLLELLWLDIDRFLVVYSSSSECHLYSLRSFKSESLEHRQTFHVGPPASKKKISLQQSSDVVQLTLMRNEVFALKSDGEIYSLDSTSLGNGFRGPVRIFPSVFDNYGTDECRQSLLVSLPNCSFLLFTRDRRELSQCLVLRLSADEVCLYRIDSIVLGADQRIVSVTPDRSSSNRYFLLDNLANLYSMEINWIEQERDLQPTQISHLIHNCPSIVHLSSLVVVLRSKELLHLQLSTRGEIDSIFVRRLREILLRRQAMPQLTFSSPTSIADEDFEKNSQMFFGIFEDEYLHRQERVRREIESKEKALKELQRTQAKEYQRLQERFTELNSNARLLSQRYDQVCGFFSLFSLIESFRSPRNSRVDNG